MGQHINPVAGIDPADGLQIFRSSQRGSGGHQFGPLLVIGEVFGGLLRIESHAVSAV